MIAVHTLRALRVLPPSACKISHFTLDEARRWLDIPLEVFEQEHSRWFRVQQIVQGTTRPVARPGARPGGGRQSLTRSGRD